MDESQIEKTDEISTQSQSKHSSKKDSRGLHGPSLGIGAGIAIVSLISAFLVIDMMDDNSELEFEENFPNSGTPSNSLAILTDNSSPVLGNNNAPITLVEFGDYQCFFCNKFFHDTESSILKNYVETGKVKIIFKDYTIIGPDSVEAANAAHCAEDQEKFWQYHDELYNNWAGENNGWASSENLIKFAKNIGLNEEVFKQCMVDKKHLQLVTLSSIDARNLGITGTPAFFVIGPDNKVTQIPGAQPYEVFSNLFEEELKK